MYIKNKCWFINKCIEMNTQEKCQNVNLFLIFSEIYADLIFFLLLLLINMYYKVLKLLKKTKTKNIMKSSKHQQKAIVQNSKLPRICFSFPFKSQLFIFFLLSPHLSLFRSST